MIDGYESIYRSLVRTAPRARVLQLDGVGK